MSTTRFPHEYQTEALSRIARVRVLLAEASGLLRACARETDGLVLQKGQLRPEDQATEIERIESQLKFVAVQIHEAPAGSFVA